MKIVRYRKDGPPQYGIVEDEQIFPCTGDPFTGLMRWGVNRKRTEIMSSFVIVSKKSNSILS
jgi:hypothetical protein